MEASVKRHDEEHVRQVGSEDPEVVLIKLIRVILKVIMPLRYKNIFW